MDASRRRRPCFVEPRLVAEVEFREWTAARTLRAPVFKGLRDDKDPAEVGSTVSNRRRPAVGRMAA